MGRFRANKEIDDFVKGFSAGSEMGYKSRYYDYLDQKNAKAKGLQDAIAAGSKNWMTPPGGAAADAPDVGGHGKGSVTLQSYDPSKAPSFLPELNSKYGLPNDYLTKTAWIESKFDPNAHAKSSSAGGLFQFIDDTASRIGLKDKFDAQASADAAARLAQENRGVLSKVLGREPTGAELYLAHQQGAKGAAQLLRNPNTPAISIVGADAVKNNGGNTNMTAGEFANLWTRKFDNLVSNKTAGDVVDAPAPQKAAIEKTDLPAPAPAVEKNTDASVAVPDKTAEAEIPEDMAIPDMQFGSCGGMIKRYANGGAVVGAVPAYEFGGMADEDSDPSDADDLMATPAAYTEPAGVTPAGNIFDDLPKAVHGGLQALQDEFGLNQQQAGAIPQANGGFMSGVMGLLTGEGAASPDEMRAIKSKVDPEGRLDDSMSTIAGLTAGYEYLLKQGDEQGARRLAGSILQYSYLKSQQLGALATVAIQKGDEGSAIKAIVGAYNQIPNGKQVTVKDGNVVVTDQKTGETVENFKLTPQILMQAANKLTDGSEFHKQLMQFASGKGYTVPEEDPAFDDYVGRVTGGVKSGPASAPSGAIPAPSTPGSGNDGGSTARVTPAAMEVDEEGLPVASEGKFTSSIAKPTFDPRPEAPDVTKMTKAHRAAAEQDYKNRLGVWEKDAKAKQKEYDDAVKSEHEKWKLDQSEKSKNLANERSTIKQRRHDEAKSVPTAFDEWSSELEAGKKPAPPPELAGRIKDIGQHLVETNDLHARDGIAYANEIANPGSKVKLTERKGGAGAVTMEDGETLNLTPRAFRTVKRMRDGYEELAKKAKEPSKAAQAISLIGEGVQEKTKAAGARAAEEATRRPRPLPPDEAAIPGIRPMSPVDKFRPLGGP